MLAKHLLDEAQKVRRLDLVPTELERKTARRIHIKRSIFIHCKTAARRKRRRRSAPSVTFAGRLSSHTKPSCTRVPLHPPGPSNKYLQAAHELRSRLMMGRLACWIVESTVAKCCKCMALDCTQASCARRRGAHSLATRCGIPTGIATATSAHCSRDVQPA